ncbi:PQQ-binding-like beta-propeller repeat protein [Actinoplanes sp. DH11]|uniref:outer membrane protein assembly factor BamB family protein n=1 Tax=Actinoplanes sp. DH11 TaxID=2857011 RepID=UPI001E5E7D84|nr:PQQ-binding-like beta-propeller repeat protein [Actinoplanes sp. DH11]
MGAENAGEPVVIDLGLGRGEPETYERPGRHTTSPWFAPSLLAVLVLLLAGASAPMRHPAVLTALLRVPIEPGDPYAITEGGRLLAQTGSNLNSYHLQTGELRWSVRQEMRVARLRTASGLLLLRPWGRFAVGTTAVSLATGGLQWRNEHNVLGFSGSSLLFAVDDVRTSSGPGRRVENAVQVVDPTVGDVRWQVDLKSTAVLLGVPGPADDPSRMLLVRDDRVADMYDVESGRLLASRALPAADYDPDNPIVAGGVLLLRHPGPSGTAVSAYGLADLRPIWTRPAHGTSRLLPCGLLACFAGQYGVRGIDPATGDVRWHRGDWRTVETQGTALVGYAGNRPVALADPVTGRTGVDLAGWDLVPGTAGNGELLVTRETSDGARTMVAVASPGAGRPRLLAELPEGTGSCQSAPERLVCRASHGELVVWAYRTPTEAG